MASYTFTEDEIKDAVFEIDPSKAPGPDGFNAKYYQVSWPIIKDMLEAVRDFFTNGKPLKEINCTFFTFVPKCPEATTLEEYRLIALCNFIYKVITKL